MNSKPPPIHETARGNGQVTTGQSFRNSPETTESNDRLQRENFLCRRRGTVRAGDLVPLVLADFMLAIQKGETAP